MTEPMTFGQLITRLREQRGISKADLAKAAGVDKGTITKIEDGVMKRPSAQTLGKLAEALGVQVDELTQAARGRTGRGLRPRTPLQLLRELAAAMPIPVYKAEQRVSAGPGGPSEPEYWYRPRPAERGHEFIAVDVSGDCLEPRLHAGQTVIIDKSASARPGDIVMALHDGEMILKILEQRDGEMWLVALQGRPPIKVSENTVIQGVARMYAGWL